MTRQAPGHLKTIVGANLRDAAEKKGLSQRDVADAVGATPAQVSKWFSGAHLPRDYMFKLADLLTDGDVSILYLEAERDAA